MTDERPPSPEDGGRGGCPVGVLGRRSFLRGTAAAGLLGAASGSILASDAAATPSRTIASPDQEPMLDCRDPRSSFPFYGYHQAGIATIQQPVGRFITFDVTATDRSELTDLFRTLTSRAAFLTAGGRPQQAPPSSPPSDTGILGSVVVPDDLTITVAVGASLFDGRYGLTSRKPTQLVTMQPFLHDDLDPALSQGDMLIQICANHLDTSVHAMLDIMAHTQGAMKPRWRIDGVHSPPRPVGIPRDWFGFKDGITNPTLTDPVQLDQQVWVQPHTAEPAWTAGGTYHVVRIVHFNIEQWQKVPVAEQERIFGRRKPSGAPMYAVDENASDNLDPIYTNDPQGLITPLNSHIRLANPQTPETAATSAILRRSYEYDRSPDVNGGLDLGHAFCCFQRELNTYITMQTRLEDELLVPYISPRGGGYFFALPGVVNDQDYYARGLLT
jgi:deferrochelatase/peroxidase EfeB